MADPLTKEQFQALRNKGLSPQQIAKFEAQNTQSEKQPVTPMFSSEEEGRAATAKAQADQQKALFESSTPGFVLGQIVGGFNTAINSASAGGLETLYNLLGTTAIPRNTAEAVKGVGEGIGMIAGGAAMGAAAGAKTLTNATGVAQSTLQTTDAIANAVPTATKAVANMAKYETELQQAGKAKEALDGIRKALGTAKGLTVAEVAHVPTEINWALKSPRAFQALQNPIYGIAFKEGSYEPVQNIGNMDKVKEALGDLISSPQMWEEAPKKEVAHIKEIYGSINEGMKKAALNAGKPIDQALNAYSEFMDKYHLIAKTIQDKAGNAMGNKLKKTFEIGAEQAYKEAWKEVAATSPEIKSVMNSMQNRVLLKNILKTSAIATTVGFAGKGVKDTFTH